MIFYIGMGILFLIIVWGVSGIIEMSNQHKRNCKELKKIWDRSDPNAKP